MKKIWQGYKPHSSQRIKECGKIVNSAYLLANLFGAIPKKFYRSQAYLPTHRVRQLFLHRP